MIRPPSLQRDYDLFYSKDPAVVQLAADATDEQQKDYIAKLTAARETAVWAPILVEDGNPTKFVFGQVDRNIWREIRDRLRLHHDSTRRIGLLQCTGLLFRLALKQIVNCGDLKVERQADPKWGGWVMAQEEIVTALDSIDEGIVNELGSLVFERLEKASGKS